MSNIPADVKFLTGCVMRALLKEPFNPGLAHWRFNSLLSRYTGNPFRLRCMLAQGPNYPITPQLAKSFRFHLQLAC